MDNSKPDKRTISLLREVIEETQPSLLPLVGEAEMGLPLSIDDIWSLKRALTRFMLNTPLVWQATDELMIVRELLSGLEKSAQG